MKKRVCVKPINSSYNIVKKFSNFRFIEIWLKIVGVEKKDFQRFLHGDGDKVTCGSRVEVGIQDPCHSVTWFLVWKWCGSGFLSSRLGFTALNYSHSIVPVENIEWGTGICPLILSRGTYGERDVRANFCFSYFKNCNHHNITNPVPMVVTIFR